jgi:hypothetical protein
MLQGFLSWKGKCSILNEDTILNNNLYNYLMEKRAEASIAQAAQVSDNRILDYARPSSATIISPRRNRNYSFAVIVGLGLPLLILILADFFNNKITEKSYIVKKTKVPVLGIIGHSVLKTELPVQEQPKFCHSRIIQGASHKPPVYIAWKWRKNNIN